MPPQKRIWLYSAFSLLLLGFLAFIVILASRGNWVLSTPVYFFLLLFGALGATAFLTGAMRSTAAWSGKVLNGQLQITGPAVVFVLIVLVGYRYRPVPLSDRFDLTVLFAGPSGTPVQFAGDSLRILFGNDLRVSVIGADGEAVFHGIDPVFRGAVVPIYARLDGFSLPAADTAVSIPQGALPVLRISLIPSRDSTLFSGFVLRVRNGHPPVPLPKVWVYFGQFNRKTQTDTAGHYDLYLPAGSRTETSVTVVQQNQVVFSGLVVLAPDMQILTHE